MSARAWVRGFHEAQLRLLLSLFFIALVIPTALLIWQAYRQLNWEAFHQYRGMAEELTGRIDTALSASLRAPEAHSFADYSFLVLSGDPSANFLQRSALSAYPVPRDLPGLLGYFQVGAQGEFSTPLLPRAGESAALYGISGDEYRARQLLADRLRNVLGNNRLVENRPGEAPGDGPPRTSAREDRVATGKLNDGDVQATAPARPAGNGPATSAESVALAKAEAEADFSGATSEPRAAAVRSQGLDSQLAFDKLNESPAAAYRDGQESRQLDAATNGARGATERSNTLGRVADLKLDATYQKKSADLELAQQLRGAATAPTTTPRLSRKEQIFVPEPVPQADNQQAATPADRAALRISTFESEVDPLEFSLLDSGHFVLFRKVWREGERYVQGMLLEQREFIAGAIDQPFRTTALSAMSDLIVAYRGDVLYTAGGDGDGSYGSRADALEGALLYRSRLSAPFNDLELIYSLNRLPSGPGASVLGWVSLVLCLVLCTGFYTLYRLGLRQIGLTRQQQDFVSAVSHELKTPLTSIRMYGEMLKEGWAPDEKKQAYYDYIHDESERLARLISNVLQLANINRADFQLEMNPVTVGKLLTAIEAKITAQIQHAGFELIFTRDPDVDVAVVTIDEDCFTQIIINLVDNAIKFSRKATVKRIEISAHQSGESKVLFSVRDFGPGIPKSQMRNIFEMFYRSENELTRETVGTGIGLAIVHQLCVAMGATVDVLNRDPGAEFRISVATG